MYRSHLNTDNIISNTKTNIYINEVLQNKKILQPINCSMTVINKKKNLNIILIITIKVL